MTLRIGACLSLTGRFGKFGQQAAHGLATWRSMGAPAELVIEDDRSDRGTIEATLPRLAKRCDLLLGPYSTALMRTAGKLAADEGWLVWNHGGSGDDVESTYPGHVVSVPTPASRYAEPFLRLIAGDAAELVIAHGRGSFGRQVAGGAVALARKLGIRVVPDGMARPGEWDLFTAGVFEDDAQLVAGARQLPNPPRLICAIAAGVREFRNVVRDPGGVYGIAQWFPGPGQVIELGPAEANFIGAYRAEARYLPDYPAAQAMAGAVIATHCTRLAGTTRREDLWSAAAGLQTSTLFGTFAINPHSGAQEAHQTVLVRWADGGLAAAGGKPPQ
jgi:ABC-type branched-subunit amino acid transport system substrate-binding protein